MITEETITEKLKQVNYPGFSRDIVSFGLLKSISVDGGDVSVKISIATKDPKIPAEIYQSTRAALDGIDGIGQVDVDIDIQDPPANTGGGAPGGDQPQRQGIPGIKHIIAVASGKGGVGKSTVASNLAVALSKSGAAVGLCDCDLYGPSMPLMFGSNEQPMATPDNQIIPIEAHGIKIISMGFLLQDDSPVIVRGPLATKYTQQFLRQVVWGELDYLVLDLPPGTGDIQLTIVQTVALDGAIIVTTPQEVALIDARKGTAMFAKVNVPILGMIENMSWFDCPSDGERYYIFGQDGGKKEAERLGVPLIGQIPINIETRECADQGQPIALLPAEDNIISAAFAETAAKIRARIEQVATT
jgi:ATP-binding protein involved in chromosome partitioning